MDASEGYLPLPLDQLSALATRALRQPDRVLSVLSELAPMASVGPVTLDEVLLVVSHLLLEVAVPPPSQRYGRLVGSPALSSLARRVEQNWLFYDPAWEQLLGQPGHEDRFEAEPPRCFDRAHEHEDRLARERLALALAAGAAERRLCLSYPRLDLGQGRPRVPSFYALEAVRAAEGRLPALAARVGALWLLLVPCILAIDNLASGAPASDAPLLAISSAIAAFAGMAASGVTWSIGRSVIRMRSAPPDQPARTTG